MNPEQRAALRAKIAEKKAKPAPATVTLPGEQPLAPTRPAAEEPPKPKKDPPPMIRHRCNHERPLHDVVNADCPACRDQKRQAKAKKKREADQRRRAAQAAGGAPVMGKAEGLHGRLPDGSRFVVKYDAGKVIWSGVLELADGRFIEGEGASVEFLLRTLAHRYWDEAKATKE